jgi:glycosyltransferase involved in cell wall biosynthesis
LYPNAVQDDRRLVPVLFLHTATIPPLGADVWVHSLIMKHLDPGSFQVHVACAKGTGSAPTPTFEALSKIPGVQVTPVNLGTELFRLPLARKLRRALSDAPSVASSIASLARYIRHNRIRIIHTSDRPRDALACVLLGRLTGAKSVIHVHVGYGSWMSRSLRWAIANADALFAISRFVGRTLVAGGIPSEKIHVVLNAIEGDRWDAGIDPAPVRRELGLTDQAKVVTCVARVFRPKGQVELVRAVALVQKKVPDVVLLIVGQDYPVGSNHSAELKELAEELGIGKNVVFVGQRSDVARMMAASDVFAMPSFEEPFGLVYAEALAMQRPVVALGDGGTPEVVEHGKSGLLSPSGDIEALAENLVTLLRDAELRKSFGEYGRRRVLERFTPGRMANDVADLYRSLVAT